MSVEDAVRRDLEGMGDLAHGALAASALALAAEMDDPENSATSKSMCARALHDALEQLRELAPPKRETDDVDDLEAKRAKRRDAARVAGAAAIPRS